MVLSNIQKSLDEMPFSELSMFNCDDHLVSASYDLMKITHRIAIMYELTLL